MKKILFILIIQLTNYCFSQNKVFMDEALEPSVSTKYFGQPIQYAEVDNKGRLNKTINLTSLKSGKLNYDLNISYSSNGLKLNDWGGALGLLWSPNFTSVIYRSVRGQPDEYSQKVNHLSDFTLNDYLTINDIYEAKVNNNTAGKDGESDVFYFNINDFNGSFIIKDGKACLLNYSEKVKIDIFETDLSYFIITAKDGVKYYYGQNNNIEESSSNTFCDPEAYHPRIKTAWFLTKIENANSTNTINFTYDTVDNSYPENFSQSKNIKWGIYSNDIAVNFPGGQMSQYESFINDSHCVTIKDFSTKYIKKIQSTDFAIDFLYNERDDIPGKFFDQIEIKNSVGVVVNKVKFDYYKIGNYIQSPTYIELGNSTAVRSFLKNIKVGLNQEEVYTFDYNNLSEIPSRFSYGQDFAGIYNGRINPNLLPKEYISNMLAQISGGSPNPLTINSFPSGIRSSFFPYNSYGLLKRITYPTKGIEEILYEPNTILKDSDTVETNFYGVRPNKIEIKDLTGNIITKRYLYNRAVIDSASNNLNFSNVSSFFSEDDSFGGFLTDGYNSGHTTCSQGPANGDLCYYRYQFYKINSNKRYDINAFQESFIAYNTVTEVIDKRFKTSIYNVIEDHPAVPIWGYSNSFLPVFDNSWNANLLQSKIEGEIINNIYRIKRITDFNYKVSNNLIEENYVVDRDYWPEYWGMNSYYSTNLQAFSVNRYTLTSRWFNNIGEKQTLILDSGEKLITNISKDYFDTTNFNNLKTITTSYPDGTTNKMQYQYANDVYTGGGDFIQKYMVGIPLLTTNYHNNIPVSKTKLSFSKYWLGHQQLQPSQQDLVPTNLINSPNEIYETDITYNQYDLKGNLVQYTTKDGIPVTIIYGYNQTLPILKVEGISYIGLMDVLGMDDNILNYNALEICQKSNIDIDSTSEDSLIIALDKIHKSPFLVLTQITTYTYDPLIGVTSITPPSGIREVYLYDSANRLMEIREGSQTGKLLKEFKYNYKN
ncbi:hypothetical protein [Chryseobacterium sp. POE27]|uniref:hypothetical protein n=1 Tax=Chryseobacterium sp. POE27 TaxID=3138177 RepID=UPI00321A57D3